MSAAATQSRFGTLHQILVSPLVGGAAVVAMHLAAAAERRSIACVAWVPGAGPASAELERAGIAWRSYDLKSMSGAAARQLVACAEMVPGLMSWRRPVVHVQNPSVYRFLRPALLATRARTIVHFHIEPSADEIHWALAAAPDYVVTCANYIADRVRAEMSVHSRQTPVASIQNAVDRQRFSPGSREQARYDAGLPTNRPVVVLIANLAPHKGQRTAIRAIAELHRRGIMSELWLAGEDRSGASEYERELRDLSRELALGEAVRFLGFRGDAPTLLRAADVLFLPSTHEGLPLTLLEAQASGLPVVGSTIPGVREIVEDGVTGFTVDATDHIGYADRAQLLLEDQAVRRRLSEAAARRIESTHSWERYETQMFAVYATLGHK